jgi:phage tail tape-measure protein
VVGALGSDGPAVGASLGGGSVSIASLNRGELGKAAGEAIPFVGTAVGLYAVGHDIGNIQDEYNKCTAGD